MIETLEDGANQKHGETVPSHQAITLPNIFSACSGLNPSLKRRYEVIWGGHLKMKRQIPNINIVRSAWRRVKKDIKDAIIRDLKPVKDVKGGRRVAG